jgi:hypothetical protein
MWPTVTGVATTQDPASPDDHERVPVAALRSGDAIADVSAGGQHYLVLEAKSLGDECVVLELESKANDQLRVIERTFPSGYEVARLARRTP